MSTKMGANRVARQEEVTQTGELSQESKDAVFRKEKLLQSARYTVIQQDVLATILNDGESYSLDQVENKLAEFLKGSV